ncbi:MAG: tRNA uridine-5-carboxymethylaminomethyl(34) synthesis GTPase MnmE [Lachnospiraceae bacterium]|nr:tRNA uridine-5-carboxymethylaminomethyl(34) synthesis GTPase MnmE [Lachnospiraceae bacterium]
MYKDTIVSIATPLSESGISIIRISGPESVAIADKIFVSKSNRHFIKECKSHTINYGFIAEGDKIIDEVMVSLMLSPKSYTTEDVVEINCHGGVQITEKILDLLIKSGARLAEPGEFTKRAFLNGRIDLSRAEAVMDLISSLNEKAGANAIAHLKGDLYNKINELMGVILHETAFIEAALDDPEHISLEGYREKLKVIIDNLYKEISLLLSTANDGELIKNGINTVIVGKPNAGKSSLLNILLGKERAIVTPVAGTTRDVITETIRLKGICLNIHDTAGIRSTDDEIEKIGVEMSLKYAKDAELIIYVMDSSRELDEDDNLIFELLGNKNVIFILNKSDLSPVISGDDISSVLEKKNNLKKWDTVVTSFKDKTGIKELEEKICKMFFSKNIEEENFLITNTRHKNALMDALESLDNVKKSISLEMSEDFISIDLYDAYASLAKIIGKNVDDDVINEVFASFCMGK